MSVAELQELEEVKTLIARGQQFGVLTHNEVATAVAELDLDEAEMEELNGFIERSEIGKVRLLTAQEEVDLAKRIERGDLDAKQKMVESNLRLVVSIAKNYRNQG